MNRATRLFWLFLGLQILFAVIIPIVTSTQLDQNGTCYLNASGSTCLFLEITSGFSLFFSLLLTCGAVAAARARPAAALPADCAPLAAFGALWWLVAAVAATTRGAQASDAGMPEGAARNAVAALSWLEFVAFGAAWATVLYDGFRAKRAAGLQLPLVGGDAFSAAQREEEQRAAQFKTAAYEPPSHVPPPAAIVNAV